MFSKIVKALSDLDREKATQEVENLIGEGVDPFKIIQNGIMQGMDLVGERFEKGYYFLPDLIRAGHIVDACSSLVKPLLKSNQSSDKGVIVVGTVAGDIHDLGKNIVISTLESAGFKVVDIGVDVPVERFVEAVRSEKALLLGMSALLTVTMVEMEKVIEALRSDSDLKDVKIMVGGAPLDQEYADKIGADAYGKDARQALMKARELLN